MLAHNFLLWSLFAVQSAAAPLGQLELVGTARLKVMFFTVYDSSLFSKDGTYSGIESQLALKIEYRRKISNRRLVATTADQWRDMELYEEGISEAWLNQLSILLPDVKKGDVLTLNTDEFLVSNFYFNDQFVGAIDAPEFTRNFLSIWLAPNSTYPELRAQLVGLAE